MTTSVALLVILMKIEVNKNQAALLRKLNQTVDRQSVVGRRVRNVVLVFPFIVHLRWPSIKIREVVDN